MENDGLSNSIDFQGYKRLTPEEREYFLFDTLCKIDRRTALFDSRYASKWVESMMKAGIVSTLFAVFAAVLAVAGIHIKGS